MIGDSEAGTRAVARDVIGSGDGNDLSFDFSVSTDLVPDSGVGLAARRFVGPRVALGGEVRLMSYDLITKTDSLVQLREATTGEVLLETPGSSNSSERIDGFLVAMRGEIHFAPERSYDPYFGLSVGTVDFEGVPRDFLRDGIDGGATFGALAGVNIPVGSRGIYLAFGVRWDSLTLESQMRDLSDLDFAPYALEGTFSSDDSAETVLFSFQIGRRFGDHGRSAP